MRRPESPSPPGDPWSCGSTAAYLAALIETAEPAEVKKTVASIAALYTPGRPGRPRGSHTGLTPDEWRQLADRIVQLRDSEGLPWQAIAHRAQLDGKTVRAWYRQRKAEVSSSFCSPAPSATM